MNSVSHVVSLIQEIIVRFEWLPSTLYDSIQCIRVVLLCNISYNVFLWRLSFRDVKHSGMNYHRCCFLFRTTAIIQAACTVAVWSFNNYSCCICIESYSGVVHSAFESVIILYSYPLVRKLVVSTPHVLWVLHYFPVLGITVYYILYDKLCIWFSLLKIISTFGSNCVVSLTTCDNLIQCYLTCIGLVYKYQVCQVISFLFGRMI